MKVKRRKQLAVGIIGKDQEKKNFGDLFFKTEFKRFSCIQLPSIRLSPLGASFVTFITNKHGVSLVVPFCEEKKKIYIYIFCIKSSLIPRTENNGHLKNNCSVTSLSVRNNYKL